MAKSKSNRLRHSNPKVDQTTTCSSFSCKCVKCVTNRNLSGKNGGSPCSIGHRNAQDVFDCIDYHWKLMPEGLKDFIFKKPRCFNDMIQYWSEPKHLNSLSKDRAKSMSGQFLFLALNYLYMDHFSEAAQCLLNAALMEEYVHKPFSELLKISTMVPPISGAAFEKELPFFSHTMEQVKSVPSKDPTLDKKLMTTLLDNVLPQSYRRRMCFSFQATRKGGHSVVGDFVNLIDDDWKCSSPSSAAKKWRQSKGTDSSSIDIFLTNTDTEECTSVEVGMNDTLKTIFNNYADEQGVSLRSLRFHHLHSSKTLFLSSLGNKTAEQVGIKDFDVIQISSLSPKEVGEADSKPVQSKKRSSPRKSSRSNNNKKGKGKGRKKQTTTAPAIAPPAPPVDDDERLKIEHSKKLSKVFDEAQPILKSIRQRLNSLSLERTLPKKRSSQNKSKTASIVEPVCNPSTVGIGAKAGKTQYIVHVGESCNLYKTTKKTARALQQKPAIITDLHGMTKDEALENLNSNLPEWKNIAMKSEYPFIIPVKIVCGGGSQVLSEVVDNWIHQQKDVANAPRHLYA